VEATEPVAGEAVLCSGKSRVILPASERASDLEGPPRKADVPLAQSRDQIDVRSERCIT